VGISRAANGALTVLSTPVQTRADLQAIADRIEDIGGLLRGTAADRLDLTSSQVKNGWLFYETDTGIGYVRRGGVWVPAFGLLPELALYPTGGMFTANGPANVANWAQIGSGGSVATPGWFEYNATTGDVKVLKSGRYGITARMLVGTGVDKALVAYLVRNGSDTDVLAQDMVRTHPTYASLIKLDIGTIPLAAGERVRMYIATTSDAINVGGSGRVSGEMNVRYLGV